MDAERMAALVTASGIPVLMHFLFYPLLREKLRAKGLVRLNYRGEEVVTAGGLILVFTACASLFLLLLYGFWQRAAWLDLREGMALCGGMLSMAFWGFLDDLGNEKQAKGIRGHFGVLWRERRMTTGVWKVIGGGTTAVLAASFLSSSVWTWILVSCLLAASANLLNLFDLRPGRAIKVFWLIVLVCLASGEVAIWGVPVIAASVALFFPDARGEIMLGDTGANALGFAAGYLLAACFSWQGQLAMLALFLLLHALAEFVSFSVWIERVAWLDRLDRWGRQPKQNRG
mgnify:CR=1 FL=1